MGPYFKFKMIMKKKKKSILFFHYDDAVNLTSEKHDPNAQMNHLHKRRKQKDLVEGIGVVPAKYPLKVKLKIFSQL